MSLRVIKLGGSLLDLPDLAGRFGDWLAGQPPRANVLIVGGGALVDAIRAADRTHGLGESASHALALQAMSLTAQLATQIFSGAQLRTSLAAIDRRAAGPLQILDVRRVLDDPRPSVGTTESETAGSADDATALPHSWDVTSDSIAAHVAGRLGAAELVLLKSALPGDGATPEELAATGFVDRHFPQVLGSYAVRIVNLRSEQNAQCRLRMPCGQPSGV